MQNQCIFMVSSGPVCGNCVKEPFKLESWIITHVLVAKVPFSNDAVVVSLAAAKVSAKIVLLVTTPFKEQICLCIPYHAAQWI